MNTQSTPSKGFTLIELMITLVLSLLITYSIAQVLISSNQSSSSSDGVSQAQETARFAMSYLAGQIRPAGLDSVTDDEINTAAIISCAVTELNDNNACPLENATGATEANITTAPGAVSGDRLALAWIPPAGVTTDCTGASLPPFPVDSIIINVFWVGFDALAGSNSLWCQGHSFDGTNIIDSGTMQAIANGVEALHVLYGEANDPIPANGTRNVSRYINANQVTDWGRVYAIKIAVMTRSLSDITNSVSRKQYSMLDAGLYNFNDAVNRQVFSSTFALSNYQD